MKWNSRNASAEQHALDYPGHRVQVWYGKIPDAKVPQDMLNLECRNCDWWDQQ